MTAPPPEPNNISIKPPPIKLPPIWVTWTLITAVGAAIFAVTTASVQTETQALWLSLWVGGGIVGGLEWQTLRSYRIPISPLWCAAKGLMMLILFSIVMAGRAFSAEGLAYILLPICGFMLDGARGWLLRSHFPRAQPWLIGCAIGWFVELGLLAGAGITTLEILKSNHTVFFALNGAINGTWMGFCRGVVLMGMLRDRPPLSPPSPSV